MSIRGNAVRGALTLALVLSQTSCVAVVGNMPKDPGPWLPPSTLLRSQIEDHAARFPWTHGKERIEEIRWFAGVGEPAYETLLKLVEDQRPSVAGSALAALGATGDSRLVTYVREIPLGDSVDESLLLERARTLVRLGDWSQAPLLIGGLRDEDLLTRALCGHALYEATGERLGFDPGDEPTAREASVERWEEWWQERATEGLLDLGDDSRGAGKGC